LLVSSLPCTSHSAGCLAARRSAAKFRKRMTASCRSERYHLTSTDVYMLSPLPRRSVWVHASLSSPVVSAFPDMAVRSACATSFSRLAQRSITLRPAHSRCHQFVTPFTGGFNHFVTSTVAPVASGWSGCRVGLAPTGKAPPYHGARQERTFAGQRKPRTRRGH